MFSLASLHLAQAALYRLFYLETYSQIEAATSRHIASHFPEFNSSTWRLRWKVLTPEYDMKVTFYHHLRDD